MPIRFPPDLMVSVSGFRGRVGSPLTPELVTALAAGFGAFLQEEGSGDLVIVGRDSRTSGPMLAAAAMAGLTSVGARVVDLGMVPTPTLMLAVEEAGAAGGIGITASHNPAEWNAMKFAAGEGVFLDAERMARFQRYLQEREPPRARWDQLHAVTQDDGAAARHLDRILALPLLDRDGLGRRGFRVALDCVRGAGATIMPDLLRALGTSFEVIHLEADGRFPRDPEPTAEHLAELGDLVRRTGADVGFAVDPDVDRLSLVDENGTPLGEDLTLALAAAVVLRRQPGVVVTNLSTSQVVEDVAASHGGRVVRAPVGEINVARRMQAEGAVVGGEGNGGVILPALHLTRDAPVGAALILQHLLDEGLTLSQSVARWPRYQIVKEKLDFPREAVSDAYRALAEHFQGGDADRADGLRLAWPKRRAWLHVRPSGTEPIVRLIAEAEDVKGARELVSEARSVLEGVG
ncbi:MAG: phosphoglucosamine mutase [Gemmatimonadota bacterium]